MSFASLCVFTYTHPVSFLSKCHRKEPQRTAKNRKEVLAAHTSYRKEVLALLSCNRKEVLAVSRTQAQATRNQVQEELLLADAKRSSCACITFGLYCKNCVMKLTVKHYHKKANQVGDTNQILMLVALSTSFWIIFDHEEIQEWEKECNKCQRRIQYMYISHSSIDPLTHWLNNPLTQW